MFANFPETFKKIEQQFKLHAIKYRILKGSDADVIKYKQEFIDGKITVLLLNANFFGAGMNLQMATDVVIYHRFTKELEQQVIGRAQRMGRETALTVYYLLHDNEDQNLIDKNEFNDMNYDEYLEYLEHFGNQSNNNTNNEIIYLDDNKTETKNKEIKKTIVKGKVNVIQKYAKN